MQEDEYSHQNDVRNNSRELGFVRFRKQGNEKLSHQSLLTSQAAKTP